IAVENKPRKHTYQLNFSAAVDVCRQFLPDHSTLSPPNVEALLLKYVLPVRNGRHDPRKVKPRSCVSFTYRVA
ncbi:MAG: IS4/IS5 family transposase, partial [Clostridia bacterium]|nr:IS4/IS5 family transposase [Clostridia bacterium]